MQITLHIVDEDYVDVSTVTSESPSIQLDHRYTNWEACMFRFIRIESSSLLLIDPFHAPITSTLDEHLDFVSKYIDSISETLRPVSLKIHDNPELNYKEFIAHETLVKFMRTRKGWKVTPSAYGIETAFIAEYDSGKQGPVISYNAEYGTFLIAFVNCSLTQYHRRTHGHRTRLWPQLDCNCITSSSTRKWSRDG